MEHPLELSCQDVRQLRDEQVDFMLLDCREPVEHGIATVGGSMLLPMSELLDRIGELVDHRDRRIVVMCHHGVRSLQTAAWLRQQGFPNVQSMSGGIDQWSAEIDPEVPRY